MQDSLFQELAFLTTLGGSPRQSRDWRGILQTVTDAVTRVLVLDRVALIELDRANREVVNFLRGGQGWDEVATTLGYEELASGLTGWVLENGEVAVSPGGAEDPRESPEVRVRRRETHCGSILVAPLGPKTRPWGTLTAIARLGQPDFSEEDFQALRLFALVASDRLELLRTQDEADRARQEVEASRMSRTSFLANLSHELRTPLNGILGFSHLLGNSVLSESQGSMVQTIAESGQRLLATIDSLLELAQIESGRTPFERSPFSPESVLNAVLAKSRATAEEKHLAWNASVGAQVPDILLGDAVRLGLAWSHVISNAVRFTDRGAITITLDAQEVEGGAVALVLLVQDSGVGMNIGRTDGYVPFREADWTTARKFGGMGLGLTLSDLIVRLMGGELELWGQPGVGTKVRLRVVIDAEETAGARLRLLLLEPDHGDRVALVKLLEEAGHRVDLAPTLAQAQGRLQRSPFDALIVTAALASSPEWAPLVRAASASQVPLVGLFSPGETSSAPCWAAVLTKPIITAGLSETLRKAILRRIS